MHSDNAIQNRFPWCYLLIAFGFSWLCWLPGLLDSLGWIELPIPFILFFFMGTWGPFISASWCTYHAAGWDGLKAFWRRGFEFRFPLRWWVTIILLPLMLAALPILALILIGGPTPNLSALTQPWMILGIFMIYFITGGGNEEWGWRGYALDFMQKRWNSLFASIVLGLIWGAWHIPLFYIESTGQYHMALWIFLVFTPGLSVLHTWVYNSTGGNLLAAWVLHTMFGTAWEIFPIVQPGLAGYEWLYVIDLGIVTVVAIAILWVYGPEHLARTTSTPGAPKDNV